MIEKKCCPSCNSVISSKILCDIIDCTNDVQSNNGILEVTFSEDARSEISNLCEFHLNEIRKAFPMKIEVEFRSTEIS